MQGWCKSLVLAQDGHKCAANLLHRGSINQDICAGQAWLMRSKCGGVQGVQGRGPGPKGGWSGGEWEAELRPGDRPGVLELGVDVATSPFIPHMLMTTWRNIFHN